MSVAFAGRQRGLALIAVAALIALGGTWWLLSAVAPLNRTALERSRNAAVLPQARSALIGWTVLQAIRTDESNPGRLPCPEPVANIGTVNEGVASGSCTLPAVGRLPWRTLGLDQLRDAAGEPLWYVVSPGWALPNSTTPSLGINSNSIGNLAVDGQANAAVAIIIAPGRPIQLGPNANQNAQGCTVRNQLRTPSSPNPLDYLECQDVAGASLRTSVVDNASNPVFNDQVVTVSAADVLAAIEAPVAARLQRDIVPQLQTVYASSQWGASAANPRFPFAAPYADPASSAFKGELDRPEGLMPLSAYSCSGLASGRCDPNFVQWKTSTITRSFSGYNASSAPTSNCSASTTSEIRCDVTYSKTLCFSAVVAPCTVGGGTVTLTATAPNVGKTLRTIDTVAISGVSSPSVSAPFITSGTDRSGVSANIQGQMPSATGCMMNVYSAGSYFCPGFVGMSATLTIRVPINLFADHPFLNPFAPAPGAADTAYWFLANNWHHVTYYAVAPLHAAGGAGNCSGANCVTVNMQGGSAWTNRRAVLGLAGRSLAGTVGSNRALDDFLDTAENRDGNTTFEQNRVGRSFNDRFVSLSP